MKNLHFYIQSAMLMLALSIAVQIPFERDLFVFVGMIQFLLGIYQFILSCILMSKLSRKTLLLKIHFYGMWLYFLMLIVLGVSEPSWMNDNLWKATVFGLPWAMALFFLVVIDELERARGYRL